MSVASTFVDAVTDGPLLVALPVAAADAAGVTLAVVLQHRFRPAAERLAALLDEGALGPIVGCSTTIRLWRPQAYYDEPGRGTLARDGGGVLMTQGIHTLDLMLSLAGPVISSCAHYLEDVLEDGIVENWVALDGGGVGQRTTDP